MAKNDIKAEIYRSYRKNFGTYLAMSISCFVVFLLVVVINYFLVGSIIVTFPFIVIPFFVGMVISVVKIEGGDDWESKYFYQYCRAGMNHQFRGSLRFFNCFIKAFLRFLLYSFIFVTIVAIFQEYLLDPNLEVILNAPFSQALMNDALKYMEDFSNPYVVLYVSLYCAAFVLSFVYFMELLSDNTMMLFLTLNLAIPLNQMVIIHKQVKKVIKKDYNRIYYSLTWPVTILFTGGFVLGAFLAIKYLQNIDLIFLLGMVCGLLFSIPYYPIAVLTIHRLFNIYSGLYYNESKEAVEKSIKSLMDNPKIPNNQKELLQGILNSQVTSVFGEDFDLSSALQSEQLAVFEEIKDKYPLSGNLQILRQIKTGLINDTYVIEIANQKYILQKINRQVFKDIDSLLENANLVSEYLNKELEKNNAWVTMQILKTKTGKLYVEHKSEVYRLMVYIDHGVTYATPPNDNIVFEAGKILGKFHHDLQNFEGSLIKNTLPSFHNTKQKYDDLCLVLKSDELNRRKTISHEIEYLETIKDYFSLITDSLENGNSLYRVIHGDPKLGNILFDELSQQGIALIDFDTIMVGSLLFDFGDAVRSVAKITANGPHKERTIELSLLSLQAFAKGYLERVGDILTPFECVNLYNSIIVITAELAIRFLEDYLSGDRYFKIEYPLHNLVRAREQINLCRQLIENKEAGEKIIFEIINKQ